MIVKPLKFNLWKSLQVSLREAIAIVIFRGKNTVIRRADFMGAIDHLNYESKDGRSARRQISCDRQVDNAGYTRDSIDSTFAQ